MERIWYELEQVMTENKNGKADKLDLKKKSMHFSANTPAWRDSLNIDSFSDKF